MTSPQEPGTLTLPDVTSILLPKNLPKFALTTTTKLEVTDSDGAHMICLENYAKAQLRTMLQIEQLLYIIGFEMVC